jgi:PPP family 3-phenylpropionic acid transporter
MSPFRTTPYWRLSSFYFFYFAALGILVPYWGLYLKDAGFSASEIGELTAILLATRIVAPNVWGWLGDHLGHRMRIVRSASLIAAVSFAGIMLGNSYLWIAAVMLVFSFFWNATLPQFEVVTLQYLGEHTAHYSRIRLWGSVGFIVTVLLLGALLERYAVTLVPYAIFIALLAIWLSSLTIAEKSDQPSVTPSRSLRKLLLRPEILAFFGLCFFIQLSHGPYYTFYTIYLEQYGYERSLIGQLWALGVVAEVVMFIFIHRWLPIIGIRTVLLGSLLLSAVRWVLIGLYPESLPILIFAQLLHAISFGTYHAAAIAWVHQYFTGSHQGRGQALYSSVSFGAGGALGSLGSGYLWALPHGALWSFTCAAVFAMIGFVIGWRYIR